MSIYVCERLEGMTMHDGKGKHTLQQISDGRLAWTRTQIGETVQLQRVDVAQGQLQILIK